MSHVQLLVSLKDAAHIWIQTPMKLFLLGVGTVLFFPVVFSPKSIFAGSITLYP